MSLPAWWQPAPLNFVQNLAKQKNKKQNSTYSKLLFAKHVKTFPLSKMPIQWRGQIWTKVQWLYSVHVLVDSGDQQIACCTTLWNTRTFTKIVNYCETIFVKLVKSHAISKADSCNNLQDFTKECWPTGYWVSVDCSISYHWSLAVFLIAEAWCKLRSRNQKELNLQKLKNFDSDFYLVLKFNTWSAWVFLSKSAFCHKYSASTARDYLSVLLLMEMLLD